VLRDMRRPFPAAPFFASAVLRLLSWVSFRRRVRHCVVALARTLRPDSPMSATENRGKIGYFQMLAPDEQTNAIRRMAASGMSDDMIAAATALSVEMVRAILGEPPI